MKKCHEGTEVSIRGVPVRPFRSMDEAVGAVIGSDGTLVHGMAVAINPEKVVGAERRPEVRALLDLATLRFADGVGVVVELWMRGYRNRRIPGVDFWERIVCKAVQHDLPVFLVGSKPNVLATVRRRLITEYPTIRLAGAIHGYFEDEDAVLAEVARTRPSIVAVAMGSPRQESLIARLRTVHEEAFYMGVGGTFDVYAGNVRRAPSIFRAVGSEWLFRLMCQPSRILRQKNLLTYLGWFLTRRL